MTQTCCGNATASTVDRCGRADSPRALDVPGRGTQFLAADRDARTVMPGRAAGAGRDLIAAASPAATPRATDTRPTADAGAADTVRDVTAAASPAATPRATDTRPTAAAGRAADTGRTADGRRTVGAGRAARTVRARVAREARLATLIRQFERDTAMLDDAVADWLGASRAELGSSDLRYEEMRRCRGPTPGEPPDNSAHFQLATPPDCATAPPDQATAPPDQATAPPDQATAPADRTAASPGQAAPVRLPAGGWSLLQKLFGEPAAAADPLACYSAAETAALIRFFSAAHERRMERIRRIRSVLAGGCPGTA